MTSPDSWTLELPYQRLPLSLNQRLHWAEKARRTKEVRDAVIVLARQARIPKCERIVVELHYRPAVRRRRDTDNPVGTLKVCIDGLVSAGVIKDDTDDYVEWQVRFAPPARPGRLQLVVWKLA